MILNFSCWHESICDKAEMNIYWKELTTASQATKSTSLESAIECFKVDNKRDPYDNELFFIKAFVIDQIIQSQLYKAISLK
jgi:predicted HD phosphohydrolase